MSDTVLVALISAGVTLIGVFVSAKSNRDQLSHEMDKKIAVINNEISNMNRKIDEHNGYAKMFSENIPAIKQHMMDVDRRLEKLDK